MFYIRKRSRDKVSFFIAGAADVYMVFISFLPFLLLTFKAILSDLNSVSSFSYQRETRIYINGV